MKKVLLMGLMALSSHLFAQTQVAFSVQIPSGVTVDSVDVTGSWVSSAGLGANWSNGLKLTLVAGKYTGIATMPSDTIEYKFRSYSGGVQSWESPPGLCTNGGGNREVIVSGASYVVGPYCFGECNALCPASVVSVNLTCRVDMNGVNRTIPFGDTSVDMVNVTGAFGADAGFLDWKPGTIPMTEVVAGSKIYERTLSVKSKVYGYKFLRANSWNFTDTAGKKYEYSEQKDSFNVTACLGGNDRSVDLSAKAAGSTTVVYFKWQSCNAGTPLGISSRWIATTFSAQPNPFNGNTTITFTNDNNEAFTLSVINAMGQEVFKKENITEGKQDIANLAPGIYSAILKNKAGQTLNLRLSAQ
jgi:Secretion system C-terminal sorting domain